MSESPIPFPEVSLEASLEAVLFIAVSPVSIAQLAELFEKTPAEIEEALKKLETGYQQGRGLSVQIHGGKVQLTSSPLFAPIVEKYLGLEVTSKLSRAALETIAIIAYRQPVTRPGIDAIRGVSSDGVIKSLLSKGMIQEVGRAEGPGRPILYATTPEFLQHFGLSSMEQLPPFDLPEEAEVSSEKNNILKD